MNSENRVIRQLIQFGEQRDTVRAVILTSTRANPQGPCDVLSDYDVILYVTDAAPFEAGEEWFRSFGTVLVSVGPGFAEEDRWVPTRLVIYEDGTRIDFSIRPVDDLERLRAEGTVPDDHGYTVLLDKDGRTAGLGAPTGREYVPAMPTESEYAALVNGFWWDSTYVAKYLWRDDLMAVKFMLDHELKQYHLRPMLEWSLEAERGWTWKPGHYGRGLTQELDPETRAELLATYAGADTEALWESLFRTLALFRKVSIRVAEQLGFQYLHDLDARVTHYHRTIRRLDRRTTDPAELTRLLREQ